MFQRHKSLKKKQLIDELESREIIIPEKIVLKALKVQFSGAIIIATLHYNYDSGKFMWFLVYTVTIM